MDELVDLVSFSDEVLGAVEKGRAHAEGLPHRAVHLWIIRGGDEPALVLQLRGADKALMPSRYDVSAAGHVTAGEAPLACALRECEEELGFAPEAEALTCLGRRVELFADGAMRNFEICTTYFLREDRALADYPIGYPEVAGLCLLPLTSLRALTCGERDRVAVEGIFYTKNGVRTTEKRYISMSDFVPRVDAYMEKIEKLATAYLAGERRLYV